MKRKISGILKRLSQYVSIEQLQHWSGQPIFFPFYHTIGEAEKLPHIRHLYPLRSATQFEKDLDYFLKYFEPIDLPELSKATKYGSSKPKFFLSFDDGLREIYHVVAPILKRKGIPATFFINPHFVDNQALFFRYKASLLIDTYWHTPISKPQGKALEQCLGLQKLTPQTLKTAILSINYQQQSVLEEIAKILAVDFEPFLVEKQPYLSTAQLQTLQKSGFHIGAHSLDHPLYATIDLSEQLRQTAESTRFIKEQFGVKTVAFAFPFTDYLVDKAFFIISKKEGYFDYSFGTAGLKRTAFPFHFQRFPMEVVDWEAADLVKTEYSYFLLKRLLGKH